MDNIIISKRYSNDEIKLEYGLFVKPIETQIKFETNNKYVLKNNKYMNKISESVFILYKEKLLPIEEVRKIIEELDNRIRRKIELNPKEIKYRKLSELYPKHNVRRRKKIEDEIFNEVKELYFNKNMKQIDIAKKLKIDPKSISHIIYKLNKNISN